MLGSALMQSYLKWKTAGWVGSWIDAIIFKDEGLSSWFLGPTLMQSYFKNGMEDFQCQTSNKFNLYLQVPPPSFPHKKCLNEFFEKIKQRQSHDPT